MTDFIRVLAPGPHYKVVKSHIYICMNTICKVYPVFAEIVGNQVFRCTLTNSKGQIVSYTLVDFNGNEYSCGKPEELAKLGLELGDEKKGKIGFIIGEDKEQMAIDNGED